MDQLRLPGAPAVPASGSWEWSQRGLLESSGWLSPCGLVTVLAKSRVPSGQAGLREREMGEIEHRICLI